VESLLGKRGGASFLLAIVCVFVLCWLFCVFVKAWCNWRESMCYPVRKEVKENNRKNKKDGFFDTFEIMKDSNGHFMGMQRKEKKKKRKNPKI
jgi:hypothetical protein